MPLGRRKRKKKKSLLAVSKEEKCITRWCRNRKALRFTRRKMASGEIKVYESFLACCWKCHSRRLKESRPWTYVLNMLRHSARKRNLPFTLTVKSFKKWCDETRYLELRGNKPGDMTIDRRDWNDGYHIDNIRMMTHAENSLQGSDNTPRDERLQNERPEDADNEPF